MSKPWRLLGSLTLLAVLAWRMDWGQLARAFANVRAGPWLLALALYLPIQAVSSLRWQLLARPLGFGGPWGRYLALYFIGMFFNLVLPTSVGGDMVRAWYLARQDGDDPVTGRRLGAFLSVFADRASGLAVLVAVACAAALCCPVPLPAWVTGSVAAVGAAALLGLAALPVLPWLQAVLPAHGRLRRLADGAALYLRHRRLLFGATALSVVVQVANVVLVWLVGEALGLPVPPLYYGVFVPLVSLLTLLPVSVNGMGLREAGTVLLLAPLGVGRAEAVALSLLTFAVLTAASLTGLGFYLFGHFPRFVADRSRIADYGLRVVKKRGSGGRRDEEIQGFLQSAIRNPQSAIEKG